MTHDYKRSSTTMLFAAFNKVLGKVLGTCQQKHRHQEWLKFPQRIDTRAVPTLDLQIIADQRIRRGTFTNVDQRISAIQKFIEQHNSSPEHLVWTAQVEAILAQDARTRATLDKTPICARHGT